MCITEPAEDCLAGDAELLSAGWVFAGQTTKGVPPTVLAADGPRDLLPLTVEWGLPSELINAVNWDQEAAYVLDFTPAPQQVAGGCPVSTELAGVTLTGDGHLEIIIDTSWVPRQDGPNSYCPPRATIDDSPRLAVITAPKAATASACVRVVRWVDFEPYDTCVAFTYDCLGPPSPFTVERMYDWTTEWHSDR